MTRTLLLLVLAVVVAVVAAACTRAGGGPDEDATPGGAGAAADPQEGADGEAGADADDAAASDDVAPSDGPAGDVRVFPPAPEVPDGPLDPATAALVAQAFGDPPGFNFEAARALVDSDDARLLWLVSDHLRFIDGPEAQDILRTVAESIGGLDLSDADFVWGPLTDILLAWDLPAYPGYVEDKARLFTAVEEGWAPFFADADATIDWRQVSWGGVFIDDRPFGDTEPCPGGCIPSLDDPGLVPGAEGGWYPDDRIVFGVEIDGDAIAFPKNIMEVHEMVNMTIGGRQVAIPYCTLCGSAQVFLTDEAGGGTGDIVMRTSGLLRRSNKVMYDLTTGSVFDTFTGEAVTGPLREQGVRLAQATVVTSTWGAWREAHPDTRIVARDGGIGRRYSDDPLRGRDDDGPIFPIGDVDPRLGVHDQVLGVETADGAFLAFPVEAANAALAAGDVVSLAGVEVTAAADGLVASADGRPIASHQAFWFAWSQFHPDTLLWEG